MEGSRTPKRTWALSHFKALQSQRLLRSKFPFSERVDHLRLAGHLGGLGYRQAIRQITALHGSYDRLGPPPARNALEELDEFAMATRRKDSFMKDVLVATRFRPDRPGLPAMPYSIFLVTRKMQPIFHDTRKMLPDNPLKGVPILIQWCLYRRKM